MSPSHFENLLCRCGTQFGIRIGISIAGSEPTAPELPVAAAR
jgi:hypothetical protein